MAIIHTILNVTIARHAETDIDRIRPRIISGQLNRSLNDYGKIQAKELAKRLSRLQYSKIYTSDAQQALETVNEIVEFQTNSQVIVDKNLRECNLGKITGMSYNDIKAFLDEFFNDLDDYLEETAESSQQFQERVHGFYNDLILSSVKDVNLGVDSKRYASNPTNILIISHGGWIDCLMRFLISDLNFQLDTRMNNKIPYKSSIYQFKIQKIYTDDYADYQWQGVVDIMNDASHLASISKELQKSNTGKIMDLESPIEKPFTKRVEIMSMLGVQSFFEPKWGRRSTVFKTSPVIVKSSTIEEESADEKPVNVQRKKSLGW